MVGLAASAACSTKSKRETDDGPISTHSQPSSGIRLVYSMDIEASDLPPDRALARAAEVMAARAKAAGISSARVETSGDRLRVEVSEADGQSLPRLQDLVSRTGSFTMVAIRGDAPVMTAVAKRIKAEISADHDNTGDGRVLSERLVSEPEGIGVAIDNWLGPNGEPRAEWYLTAEDREVFFSPAEAKSRGCLGVEPTFDKVPCWVSGRQVLEDYLAALAAKSDDGESYRLPDDLTWGFEAIAPEVDGASPRRWRTHVLTRSPRVDNSGIADAVAAFEEALSQYQVEIVLTDSSRQTFAELTTANVGNKIAIVIDGAVQSAPVVQSPITGGRLRLSLGHAAGKRQVEDLAIVLDSGPLPGLVRQEAKETFGPPPQ